MARMSNMLLLNATRQAIPMACIIIFIAIYFPEPCNAGNSLRHLGDSTISAVRQHVFPALLNAAQYTVRTRVGQAVVNQYNSWLGVNGVELKFKHIPESDPMPYPPGLFQQYIIAAQEALQLIDKSAPVSQAMVSHLKKYDQTIFRTRVLIIHTDSTPKSGMKSYETAEKIVSEMEKASLVTDFTKLMEIRGDYNGISVVCKIDVAQGRESRKTLQNKN